MMVFSAIRQQFFSTLSFRKYWKTFFYMILFDLLFLGCLYAAAILFDMLFITYEASLVGYPSGYGLLLAYFIVVCFAYSFFTYCNLSFLHSIRPFHQFLFTKRKIFFFFLYNLIIGITFFLLFFLFWTFFSVALVTLLKQTIVPVLLFLLILFAFLFLQLSHTLFAAKKEIEFQELVKKSFQLFSFQWIGQFVLWNLVALITAFLGYTLLFGLLSKLGQSVADTGTLLQFYALNIIIFLYLVFITYCFFFFNRLYLFIIARREIEKKKL